MAHYKPVNIALMKADSKFGESSESASFCEVLESHGYSATVIPTLSFEYSPHETLERCLALPELFSGIIFTSPRAVEAFNESFKHLEQSNQQRWAIKYNFCVGPTTSQTVKLLLRFVTFGDQCGSVEELCRSQISTFGGFTKPFLYPCSNRVERMPDVFFKHGIVAERFVVYQTKPNPEFPIRWKKLIDEKGLPDVIVYFSPSGVGFTFDTVIKDYPVTLRPKFVAIGKTTENALSVKRVTCKTALKPVAKEVLAAVQSVICNHL